VFPKLAACIAPAKHEGNQEQKYRSGNAPPASKQLPLLSDHPLMIPYLLE
jgi:hypothetical protein